MILQALTNYYEVLARTGKEPRDGWSNVKVLWALDLLPDGTIRTVLPLSEVSEKKGKKVETPRTMSMPAPFKRSSGIQPNFICDNAMYLLGIAKEEKDKKRAKDCFQASKQFHLDVMKGCSSPAAKAVSSFFEKWNPDKADEQAEHFAWVNEIRDSSGNLTFYVNDMAVSEDEQIENAWDKKYHNDGSGETAVCLIMGRRDTIVAVHPAIKGVKGAQSSGAALVSFNAEAFTSYGKEQNYNAPMSRYTSFAYTTALNHLIADGEHRKFIGDATVVYWAENGEASYQDYLSSFLDGGNDLITDQDLDEIMKKFSGGGAIDLQGHTISPEDRFFILAIAPNNARLAVRFFYDTSFGEIVENFRTFYQEMNIIGVKECIPLWQIMKETVRRTSDGKAEPQPQLSGDMLRAVLTGQPYPETFYQQILLRIHSECDVRPLKAAAIKAFLLRNRKESPKYKQYKEVLDVKLNEETTYLPYVLGELFAVLEAIQERASGATTIKSRYFTSACSTPAVVFPRIIDLANHHLNKLDGKTKYFYSVEMDNLISKINESYPAHMSLNDQGIFQIGYYHKRQKRFENKAQTSINKEETIDE